MLRADVVVIQAPRLIDSELDDLLGTRCEADLADGGAVTPADDELNGGAHLAQLDAEVCQHLGGDPVALAYQAEEQVLRADVIVVETLRLFLRQRQYPASPLREFVEPICHLTYSLALDPP